MYQLQTIRQWVIPHVNNNSRPIIHAPKMKILLWQVKHAKQVYGFTNQNSILIFEDRIEIYEVINMEDFLQIAYKILDMPTKPYSKNLIL